jgi:hypothetical protein
MDTMRQPSKAKTLGSRKILVRLGCTPLTIRAGLEHRAEAGHCRLEIDPHSIQPWEIN